MAYPYPQPAAGPYGPYAAAAPYGALAPAYGAPAPYAAYGALAPPYGAPAPVPPYGTQMQFQPQGQFSTAPVYSQQSPPPYSASFSQKSYFFIRSRLNGLVLDVQGANPAPGTPVITWNQKSTDNSNQLWFEDSSTGTIRCKLNEYCLDVAGNKVVLMPYKPGNANQLWEPFSNVIRNRHQLKRVLTVDASAGGSGARIVVGNQSQQKNQTTQLFDFQFTSPQDVVSASASSACQAAPRLKFRIVSEMNCKVLDIRGDNPCSGAEVIMYPKKPGSHKNQLWYFDSQGIIRSALNDMALDSGVGGQKVKMMPFTGEVRQQWHLVGNKIINQAHECLDIRGESNKDGAEVISYKYKGSANQHWRIEYE